MGTIVPVTKKTFATIKNSVAKKFVTKKFVTKKNLLASLATLFLLSVASPASFSSTVKFSGLLLVIRHLAEHLIGASSIWNLSHYL
jgi:hypothetical protein